MTNKTDITSSRLTVFANNCGWPGTIIWRNHCAYYVAPDGAEHKLAFGVAETETILLSKRPPRKERSHAKRH